LQGGRAFHISYSDTGIFGIYSQGGDAGKVSSQLLAQVKAATSSLSGEALDSAKNFAKIKVLSSLEDPLQLSVRLAVGGAGDANQIDSVTAADVQRIASSLAAVSPVVVAGGDVRGVGRS